MTIIKKYWIYYCYIAILYLCFSFLLWHTDAVCIVGWAKAFWDGLASGRFRDYAYTATEATGYAINYNIVISLINAVFVFPAYLLDRLLNRDLNLVYYVCCYKVYLVAVIAGSAYYLKKFLRLRDISEEQADFITMLFLISGPVLHGNIGSGQVDCVGNFFLILALYHMQKKDYWKMSLAAGMIIVCKGIGIIFFFPLFLLLFGKKIWDLVRYGVAVLVPTMVGWFLSHAVFRDFAHVAHEAEKSWNHLDRFFTIQINSMPLFLTCYGLILVVCLAKALRGTVQERDFILFPLLSFLSFSMFVFLAPYWFIYGVVFFILGIMELPWKEERGLVMAGLNLGYWAYSIARHMNSNDNAMVRLGMIGYRTGMRDNGKTYMSIAEEHMPSLAPYIPTMAMALWVGFMSYLVFAYYQETRNPSEVAETEGKSVWNILFLGVTALMPVIYLVSSLMIYFR